MIMLKSASFTAFYLYIGYKITRSLSAAYGLALKTPLRRKKQNNVVREYAKPG